MDSVTVDTMEMLSKAASVACDDAGEAQHARDLLVMEEEARIRRQNLMKRINYEHCIQQKEREELRDKISRDIRRMELNTQNELYRAEFEVSHVETRVDMLEENTPYRTAHIQKCHDNQVGRLMEYRARLEAKIADIHSLIPAVEEELERLENPRPSQNEKLANELDTILKNLTRQSSATLRRNFEEEDQLKEELDSLVNPDAIKDLENDLRKAQQESRSMHYQEEEVLSSLQHDLAMLRRQIDQIESDAMDDLEGKCMQEIAELEKSLETEQNNVKSLKEERVDLKAHFKQKFDHKFKTQSQNAAHFRDSLQMKLNKIVDKLNSTADAVKSNAAVLAAKKAEKSVAHNERLATLESRKARLDAQFKKEMKQFDDEQGKEIAKFKQRLALLTEVEEHTKSRFDQLKDQLEASIELKTDVIPSIMDAIEAEDKKYINEMSNRQGDLGKTEMTNQLFKQANKSGASQVSVELFNLDNQLEAAREGYEGEISKKEEELQDLLNRHRAVGTDYDLVDKKVRLATGTLNNEANQCKYKMRCLRAIIRDQNKVLAGMDGSAFSTERELQEVSLRSVKAHEEEKARLQKMFEDEENSHMLACIQLKEASDHASRKQREFLRNYEDQRSDLLQKLCEKQQVVESKANLSSEIKILGNKIDDLDRKLTILTSKHEAKVNDMRKSNG